MKGSKKVIFFKITLLIAIIAIMIVAIIYFMPYVKNLSTTEGQIAFKDKLDSLGWKSILVMFAIQVIQIFLIIIPGAPIQIIAGMCYGTFWGTVFIIVSSAIISAIIFLLVRKFGKKFIYSFCDEKQVEKIENSKAFKNPKKVEMVLAILYLIPGTPNDLFTYIAGLLPIKPLRYILISTTARIPSIIISAMSGTKLTEGNWQFTIIANISLFIIAIVIVYIYNKFDKDKVAEEALNTIK